MVPDCAALLFQRFSLAAAELNGVLYATGGYDGNGYLRYDLTLLVICSQHSTLCLNCMYILISMTLSCNGTYTYAVHSSW